VFDLIAGKAPTGAYYTRGTSHTEVMLHASKVDITDPSAIAEWYERYLNDPAVDKDRRGVQVQRSAFAYEATARQFRMIDEDMVSVVVPWPEGHPERPNVLAVLGQLRSGQPATRASVRSLQEVTVAVRRRVAEQALRDGQAERVNERLLEWTGEYDNQVGLVFTSRPQEVLVW
jgi:hypothetical protein